MVKKVITNLDLSKSSGLDFIPVVFLKTCVSELSYILAEFFNMCRKASCFPDCWKVSLVVPVFKNVGERSTAKNYRHVFYRLFSDFQCSVEFSRSTADLLTVVEVLGLLTGLGLLEL